MSVSDLHTFFSAMYSQNPLYVALLFVSFLDFYTIPWSLSTSLLFSVNICWQAVYSTGIAISETPEVPRAGLVAPPSMMISQNQVCPGMECCRLACTVERASLLSTGITAGKWHDLPYVITHLSPGLRRVSPHLLVVEHEISAGCIMVMTHRESL